MSIGSQASIASQDQYCDYQACIRENVFISFLGLTKLKIGWISFHQYYLQNLFSNEEWSSQLWSQFLQLRKEAWKKFRTSTGPRWSPEFFCFRLLYAIVKIAITTARIILHLISYPQFTYDLFHMHHSLKTSSITRLAQWLVALKFY